MFKNLKAIAGTAIIVATLATTTVQAKQVVQTDTAKTEQVVQQKFAKAAPAPFYWLVLGVGY